MRTLKKGMSGADVQELQSNLNVLGYDCGKVDGKFGDKTDAAVRRFQAVNKLTVDGAVGPATQAAIKKALEEIEWIPADETIEPIPHEDEPDPITDIWKKIFELEELIKILEAK